MPKAKERNAWDNAPTNGGGFGPFVPETDQVLGNFWGTKAWEGPDSDFPDVVNTDAAITFLREKHDRPFMLTLGLWRPHSPFTAPKRFFDMFDREKITMPPAGFLDGDLDDVPAGGKELAAIWGQRWPVSGLDTPEVWRRMVHGYLATTAFADWSSGRVIEALDASPYADTTIVIFWSDNGYHCGEKNHWEKSTLWEKSALTPLAIRLPGRRYAGDVCTRPVGAIDFYPTLVDLCGLAKPAHILDGVSLRPLLENPTAVWDRPAVTETGPGLASVRDERYRYLLYRDGGEELYDHDRDPHELHNLAAEPDSAPIMRRLREHLPKSRAVSLGGRAG